MPQGSPQVKGFDTVLVLDFGAQYGQLIARRVRECRVYSELIPHDISIERIKSYDPKGIILSGGPMSVYVEDAPRVNPELFDLGIPMLGICYGAQGMALELGGTVAQTGLNEFGKTVLTVQKQGLILDGMRGEEQCWMSHRDSITVPPAGFDVLASTQRRAGRRDGGPRARLLRHPVPPRGRPHAQGHGHPPCVPLRGLRLCSGVHAESIIDESIRKIREQVGESKAILGLSGGVDSSVAALLMHRAIGDQLTCVFVDQGMMRMNEADHVVETFSGTFGIPLVAVDASDRFLGKLEGVTEPERKRKIIGEEFIRCFEEEARKLTDVKFLVQGTLYSDVIESGTRQAAKIKSHHNVGGLPEKMDFELVEPLRWLFKDEVRAVGEELGLPEHIVWRQPFPGPGLAIRIIGEITRERVDVLQRADAIVQEEIRKAGLYRELWQCFAILPVIRSVGVQGDERTYGYPIVIRAVTSDDAMTADWARLPYELLETISSRIINEVPEVNRVVYDISSKPPSTIEWE